MPKYMWNIQCICELCKRLKLDSHSHFDMKYDMKINMKFQVHSFCL
jgi:hypothetical protein